MKYWMIVKSGINRKKIRTFMTIFSIATAFLLFSLGRSVAVAFNSEVDFAGKDRLIVVSRLAFTESLPMAHKTRIESVEGVETVVWRQWFGGTYIDRQNFFPKWPVPENYFDVYPEWELSEGAQEAFSRNITGIIVGKDLADKFGWNIGDRIPIIADIWPKKDGGVWEFDIVGTYINKKNGEQDEAFINWKYFDEARIYETGRPGNYIVKVKDPEKAETVAKEIDELFKNSLDETKTSTEEAFSRMFAEQIGNIGLIINSVLAASFFTILLLTGNTMSQAVRERTPELGALKAVGFSDRLILFFILAESFFLCVSGALIGVIIAYLLFPMFSGVAIGFSGEIDFSISIVISSVLVALVTAVISGTIPALSAMRLNVVDALRKN